MKQEVQPLFFRKANSIFKKASSFIWGNIASHPFVYISCFLLIAALSFYLPSLTKDEKQRAVLSSLTLEKESLLEEIDSLKQEKEIMESKIDSYGKEAEFWKEKADELESYLMERNENE